MVTGDRLDHQALVGLALLLGHPRQPHLDVEGRPVAEDLDLDPAPLGRGDDRIDVGDDLDGAPVDRPYDVARPEGRAVEDLKEL